jgi:hypothetical protein
VLPVSTGGATYLEARRSWLLTDRSSVRAQFSHAYHIAHTTKTHRAVLDILYRADLAHLYDVYLGTLNTLSGYTAQLSTREDIELSAAGGKWNGGLVLCAKEDTMVRNMNNALSKALRCEGHYELWAGLTRNREAYMLPKRVIPPHWEKRGRVSVHRF